MTFHSESVSYLKFFEDIFNEDSFTLVILKKKTHGVCQSVKAPY